jgi:hypothetical protein
MAEGAPAVPIAIAILQVSVGPADREVETGPRALFATIPGDAE